MSIRKIGTAVVTAALFCLGTLGMAQTPRHVAVHAGHLLDVKTGKLLADQTLVIEDGRILSTGAVCGGENSRGCSAHRSAQRNRAAGLD